jgi:hypothetical protein
MAEGGIPAEALISLRRRLDAMPARSADRKGLIASAAALYGVSRATLYRALKQHPRPRALRRSDRGQPRKIPLSDLERYCEIIAALKIRTTNKKGRHLSTVRAIELIETYGIETPDGLVQPSRGLLRRSTVNRYLRQWGYDHTRMTREPPAVRFQARRSNELWQFDLSPSDLKQVKHPLWAEAGRGHPTLMLYSVVDDRSGAAYQEYRCVYGEDVEAALRFLFNAMAPKAEEGLLFQGIPEAIYMDNGPIKKSQVFQAVMDCLGVQLISHMPAGQDGRRTTARSKGKVERPFRTVKEAHETLYHFHAPENEAEANLWLHRYLMHYNNQPHRSEPHSRLEDWLANLPETGLREMCSWERFCAFAREPEQRKVGSDARLTVEGTMRLMPISPARPCCYGGACSIRTSMSNTPKRGTGPTCRLADRSRCTAIANSARPGPKSGPIGLPSSRNGLACRAPPWKATRTCLGWQHRIRRVQRRRAFQRRLLSIRTRFVS